MRPRVILHLDMDAFYASVEQRDNPELRGKPVIVGSPPTQRGVVAAASYEARKFGVRSALPSVTAGRLCPNGIFIRPRMEHYRAESHHIMAILADCGADVERTSIDEAYLDVSRILSETPDVDTALEAAIPIARGLKERIRNERNLSATVGIGSNKLLAKIASDFKKPDGLTLIPERDKAAFLRPISVRAIPGVGRVTEEILNGANIKTIADVQDYTGDLRALLGSYGPVLKKAAFGEDERVLDLGDEIKSISSEETFGRDTDDRRILRQSLRSQAEDVAARLKNRQLGARTVQVKIRYGDFTTLTRQFSVEEPVSEPGDIYRLGCFLLARERLVNRPLRLIGLGVSGLSESVNTQLMMKEML
ncbi:MAG: DNA polymerase IV [Limisphaerales bacterium]